MYLSVSMREKIRDYETILILFFLVIDGMNFPVFIVIILPLLIMKVSY